jgi:hypothetical protein
MARKNCFMNAERPCDLTCKAAFEVDDPVDNVDCYFIWLSHHFGEGLFEMRRVLEGFGGPGSGGAPGGPAGGPGGGPGAPPGPKGPKGPKGVSNN